MKKGDKVITRKKIYFSNTWVGISKGVEGEIIEQHTNFSPTKRWIVKFKTDDEPVIVFENEIKQLNNKSYGRNNY